MKNLIILLFTSLITLSSCNYQGGDSRDSVSSLVVDSGFLVSKAPTNFDCKFGYELMVKRQIDSSKASYNKVYVSKQTYEVLPEPNDFTKVFIYYVKNIEIGENTGTLSLYDFQFNFCSGYRIIRIGIKDY
ncbi:MAG: hypothetical protein QG630_530 [Patescibacteria group bacterium]|nr:hypothetical protein [Patescibacteria group bacterium]